MSVRAEICRGVTPEWAELAVGGPLLTSPGWLRAMTGRLGDHVITIVVREDGVAKLAAFASVLPSPFPHDFFDLHHVLITEVPALPLTAKARTARAELAAGAPGPERWTPNLVVMLPGYECLPVGPGASDPRLLNVLVETAVRWADQQRLVAVGFLYLRPDQTGLAAALAANGFAAVPLSITWDLPVPADGMAGYLRALPRKRRQDAVRELGRLAEAGIRLRTLEPAEVADDAVIAGLVRLRCQLIRKYRGSADESAERRRFDALITDVCRGTPLIVVAQADHGTVGFAMFYTNGPAWYCLGMGYDYADPRSRYAYFGTAFYGVVPFASAAGAVTISYGQGASDAKRARGCVGTPLTSFVRSADQDLAKAISASAAITEIGLAG